MNQSELDFHRFHLMLLQQTLKGLEHVVTKQIISHAFVLQQPGKNENNK